MNNQGAAGIEVEAVQEDSVVDYLQHHPDFFERHASMLSKVRLSHDRGAATVSLVERQVQVLREKNEKLERRLRELVEVARTNEGLVAKIHRLACRLIAAEGAIQLLERLEASLREDFGASDWRMVVLRTDVPGLDKINDRHLKVASRESSELRTFDTFFESDRPRCGQIRDTQRDYLFGAGTVEVGSAAMVPLGPKGAYGLLAIASHDAERFHPTMSTDFLARIGEVVGEAVGAL
jgi:uncharacterized protein YigA (DUF484 family)